MEPTTLLIAAGLAYMAFGRKKTSKGSSGSSSNGRSPTKIYIAEDCQSYEIPDSWYERIAQPRWESYLEQQWPDGSEAPPDGAEVDVLAMLLAGQLGERCEVKPGPDFEERSERGKRVLGSLRDSLMEHIEDAIGRYRESGGTDTFFLREAIR